jgi:Ca2+-binding EF-hand superfamily protein
MNHWKSWTVAGMALVVFSGVVHGKEAEKDAARPRMNVRKVMTQFDKDKNGKIEGAEAEALRKAFEGDLKSQLSKFDRDGNGKLDDAEVAAIKVKAAVGAGGVVAPKGSPKTKRPGEGAPVK